MNVNVRVKASLAAQSVTKEMEHLSVELAGKLKVVGEGQREYISLESSSRVCFGTSREKSLFGGNKIFILATIAHHTSI